PYTELTRFTARFGADERCRSVEVTCDGMRGEVALFFSSGEPVGLDFTLLSPGLPAIRFRRETEVERRGKRAGVTHEYQTGDASFDELVFVESDHADEDVAPVLSAPAVRAAVARLIEGGAAFVEATGRIVRTHVQESADVFDPDRIAARLHALRVLAGAPRSIAPRRVPLDVWQIVGTLAAIPSLTAPFVALALWDQVFHPVSAAPAVVGVGAGVALTLLLQPLLGHAVRGRSDSHVTLLGVRIVSVLLVPPLTLVVLLTINAAFDGSREREHALVVESVSYDEDDDWLVSARDERGGAALGRQEFRFHDRAGRAAVGQRLVVGVKRGALGWAWRSSPARLTTPRGVLVET
ncbi:MAG TPA: hypothetical protein VHB21_11840, partial [Minicystis sp.]|nr:hypothetical protein [Minicystis sp.]